MKKANVEQRNVKQREVKHDYSIKIRNPLNALYAMTSAITKS